jgi:hypothetical protein
MMVQTPHAVRPGERDFRHPGSGESVIDLDMEA